MAFLLGFVMIVAGLIGRVLPEHFVGQHSVALIVCVAGAVLVIYIQIAAYFARRDFEDFHKIHNRW